MKRPFLARLASRPQTAEIPAAHTEFHVTADQLPRRVLDRLRHPSAPTYLVAWDPTADAVVWRPTAGRFR